MSELQEKPLISAIIPTYNRANLVARAIKSVIEQTYENLEIIVVDDASKDNTEEVIKAIVDPRICYICHSENRGGAASRNTGIDAAKGKYVAFLDSDDVWFSNKIQLQIASIQNYPHPEKVVSYTQFKAQGIEESCILPIQGKNETEALADYLFVNRGEISSSILMLPRLLAAVTRFRPELKKHQDWDFALRLEAKGAIFDFVDKPLTIWYNDRICNRISTMSDYKISLNWIQGYQGLISNKAAKGFLIKVVVPKMLASEASDQEKIYAARLILYAGIHGLIPLHQFFRLTVKALLPNRLHKKLKNLWLFQKGNR